MNILWLQVFNENSFMLLFFSNFISIYKVKIDVFYFIWKIFSSEILSENILLLSVELVKFFNAVGFGQLIRNNLILKMQYSTRSN